MNNNKYKTKQREVILEFLKNNPSRHFTADDVFLKLKDTGKSVGKSTVYRYLEMLEKEGSVKKYIIDDTSSACYEYINDCSKCENHFHLKCSDCGALIHIDCDFLDQLNEHVLEDHNFHIDNSRTVLYGQCNACSGKNH